MTQSDRRERRKHMAEAVREGKSLSEVCLAFSVSHSQVARACCEFGVIPRDNQAKVPVSAFRVLALLLQSKSTQEVREVTGLSISRINQIRHEARKHGVQV